MIETLPPRQREIIDRAAGLLRPAQRESFRKFTFDVLRAKPQPLSNSDVRHACCASLLKYRRPS
jgi:hypothetical protein